MNHGTRSFGEEKADWRSFICLLVVQTQNAFNDNFARFLLVPLVAFLARVPGQEHLGVLQHVLAVSLVIPFLLFSPFAGWLADRLPKNRVVRWSSWFQLVALLGMAVALWQRSLAAACVMFFLLALQSALLSPAKMGIVKEQVGGKKLALASGLMEMLVILAILGGQIWANFTFSARVGESLDPWDAAFRPIVILAGAGIVALVTAYGMRLTKAQNDAPLTTAVLVSHGADLKMLFGKVKLGKPALLAAYFWGFGGFLNLICIQAADSLTGGGTQMGATLAWLLVAASGGIALGAGCAGWISRKRIEIGLAPLGGLIMLLALLLLSVQEVGAAGFSFFLAAAGLGGAFLVVPLTAYLQDESPEDQRGKVMAASNLLNNAAGVLGVLLQFGLQAAGVSLTGQILIGALSAAVVSVILLKGYAAELFRFVGLGLLGKIYRTDVVGVENVPEDGGVLLLPNHVGYSDAVILSLACPRQPSFLVAESVARKWWASWAVKLFQAVPISPTRAKEAISRAGNAVKEGKAVTIYPEGQLTRTGMMNEVKSGFSLIARRGGQPVVPVYVDGLWGSLFSYSDGRYLQKWPQQLRYDLRVAYGKPLPPKEATAERVRRELLELGRQCWERRETKSTVTQIDKNCDWPEWQALSPEKKESIVMNALQLSEVYPAQRGKRLAVIRGWDELDLVFGVALPAVSQIHVEVFDGVESMKGEFDAVVATRGCIVNHERVFSLSKEQPAGEGEWTCWVKDGRVLTVSMPDIPMSDGDEPQKGSADGSLGRLLPGVSVMDGRLRSACGLVCDFSHYELDESGFVKKAGA